MMKKILTRPMIPGIAIVLGVVFSLLTSSRVSAIVNNNANVLPSYASAVESIPICTAPNGDIRRYAQTAWISVAGQPLVTSAQAQDSDTYINLDLNVMSAVCNNNIKPDGTIDVKDKIRTRNRVTGASTDNPSATIGPGLVLGAADIVYNGCYSVTPQCRYFKQPSRNFGLPDVPEHITFSLNIAALTPGTYTILITANVRAIHQTTAGNFSCVSSGTEAFGGIDDNSCPAVPTTMPIQITITNSNPPRRGSLDGAICRPQGLDLPGWAIDGRDVSRALTFDFYFDNNLGPINIGGILANRNAPDLTDASTGIPGVSGNQRHRLPTSDGLDTPAVTIPYSWLSANGLATGSHTVWGYAHDIDGNAFAVNFGVNASANFSCPQVRYNVVPNYTIKVNGSTATVDFNANNTDQGASRQTGGVGVTMTYYITVNGATVGSPTVDTNQVINGNAAWPTHTLTASNIKGGDRVCAYMSVDPGRGVTDGVADPNSKAEAPSGSNCITASFKPYSQVWRGDIAAGGSFGQYDPISQRDNPVSGTCDSRKNTDGSDKGSINTWGRIHDDARVNGSFAQYGAFANGKIDLGGSGLRNFFSQIRSTAADLRAQTSGNGSTLDFSNDEAVKGNFSASHCIHDYYTQFSSLSTVSLLSGTDIDLNALSSGTYKLTQSNVTLRNSAAANWLKNKRITLVSDGNIQVTSNISLADASGNLTDVGGTISQRLNTLSFLMVIARGNIFINSSVNKLDGVWVAQPDDPTAPTNGIFDDCANASGSLPNPSFSNDASFYAQCTDNNDNPDKNTYNPGETGRLNLNGRIVAQRILLRRLSGDLFRTSVGGEDSIQSTHAAERFGITPEIYFANPSDNPVANSGPYDSIESLPPVL